MVAKNEFSDSSIARDHKYSAFLEGEGEEGEGKNRATGWKVAFATGRLMYLMMHFASTYVLVGNILDQDEINQKAFYGTAIL